MKRRNAKRAVAAVVFVAALLVVSTMALWVFQATAASTHGALGHLYASGAFYASEGGIEYGLREIALGGDVDGDGTMGSISNNGNDADDPSIGSGTFHVSYASNKLTSRGSMQSRTRVLEATLN